MSSFLFLFMGKEKRKEAKEKEKQKRNRDNIYVCIDALSKKPHDGWGFLRGINMIIIYTRPPPF